MLVKYKAPVNNESITGEQEEQKMYHLHLNLETGAFIEEKKFVKLVKGAVAKIDRKLELTPSSNELYLQRYWLLYTLGDYYIKNNKFEEGLDAYLDSYNFMLAHKASRAFWNALPYHTQLYTLDQIAKAKFITGDYWGARGQLKTILSLSYRNTKPLTITYSPKEDMTIRLAHNACMQWRTHFPGYMLINQGKGHSFRNVIFSLIGNSSAQNSIKEQEHVIPIVLSRQVSSFTISGALHNDPETFAQYYLSLSKIYLEQSESESTSRKIRSYLKNSAKFCVEGFKLFPHDETLTQSKILLIRLHFEQGCRLQTIMKRHYDKRRSFGVAKLKTLAPRAIIRFSLVLQLYSKFSDGLSGLEVIGRLLLGAHFNRGRLLLELGEIEKNRDKLLKAQEDFHSAIKLLPEVQKTQIDNKLPHIVKSRLKECEQLLKTMAATSENNSHIRAKKKQIMHGFFKEKDNVKEFERWKDRLRVFENKKQSIELNELFLKMVTSSQHSSNCKKKIDYLLGGIKSCLFSVDIHCTANNNYNSTVIHELIANEDLPGVSSLLFAMRRYEIDFDFSKTDAEGKTSLLTAIKVPSISSGIISMLITEATYNKPDINGVTPLMVAASLGNARVVDKLIKFAKQTLTEEEFKQDFLGARDNKRRTVVHYVCMREGGAKDLVRGAQNTVAGILDSVHVDKNRDKNAKINAIRDHFENRLLLDYFTVKTLLTLTPMNKKTYSFARGQRTAKNALLADCTNAKEIIESDQMGLGVAERLKEIGFSGISLAADIMSNRMAVLALLFREGVDFTAKHVAERTPVQIINSFQERKVMTPLDKKYLLPICARIYSHLTISQNENENESEHNSVEKENEGEDGGVKIRTLRVV